MIGLGRRGHQIARDVVAGGTSGSTRVLRFQALQALHQHAAGGAFADASLVPIFAKAARTADGDPQRTIALTALEGFWSKDSLADLDEVSRMEGVSPELRERAQRTVAAIRAGEPKPKGAGEPHAPGRAPAETEPPTEQTQPR
jgi:hypothetical protein